MALRLRELALVFTVRYCENVPAHTVTSRIIRNPNYGGPGTIVPGTCMLAIRERKIKPEFFKALRLDVAKNGFRNPILLYSTPQGLLLSFGGSRLRVAKEMSMMVPAIIVDYDGSYFHCDQVTQDNYAEFFTDVPVLFEFTKYGVDTHYSLERNRRDAYDEAGMEWTKFVDDTSFLEDEFPWLSE